MRAGALLLVAAALAPWPAAAQLASDQVPRPDDPLAERVDALEPAAAAPAPVEPGLAAESAFVLRGVRLQGADTLGADALAPLWQPLLGAPVTLADLEAVAEAIGARYRAEGYVLSQAFVPAQVVENGVATLVVIEGFVDRVMVDGGPPGAVAFAERRFAPVAAARPLRVEALERAVILTRDTLGPGVETVLAPSETTFGAADLTVLAPPDRVTGFFAADNRGSRLYGDVSASAGLTLRGLLGGAGRLEFVAAGDPLGGSLGFLGTTLRLRPAAFDGGPLDGTDLAFGAEVSNADPDLEEAGSPDGLDVTVDGWAVTAGATVPFVRSRAQSVIARFGVDYRESANVTGFAGLSATARDQLLAAEAGVSWDRVDGLGGVSILDVDLRQGLGGDLAESGPGAPAVGFTRARMRLARVQRLGGDWSLLGEVLGQVSSTALPSAERFSLGGATIGRGFAPGNTTGDSGLGGRLELRRRIAWEKGAAEVYGFGDYGEVWNRSAVLRGIPEDATLGSVGIGARIDFGPVLTLTPELVRQVSGRASDRTASGLETRAYIGLIARF